MILNAALILMKLSSGLWAAFKIVAASLEARGAFKIVACFLYHGTSKVCLQVHFCFIWLSLSEK